MSCAKSSVVCLIIRTFYNTAVSSGIMLYTPMSGDYLRTSPGGHAKKYATSSLLKSKFFQQVKVVGDVELDCKSFE